MSEAATETKANQESKPVTPIVPISVDQAKESLF
jgi:hypothetical protein